MLNDGVITFVCKYRCQQDAVNFQITLFCDFGGLYYYRVSYPRLKRSLLYLFFVVDVLSFLL